MNASDNLYEILGVSRSSDDNEIRKAYKKLCLTNHPDKGGSAEEFQKIQKAYETLSDPAKRKKYDSTLPFDEDIPDVKKDKIDDSNFFDIFGKCFTNNARYSTIKPVPNIGEENTTIEEVQKFYKFWDSFKTWREFS
jgi:DnaJ family protein C protein 2